MRVEDTPEWTPLEEKIAAAKRAEPPRWTPDCLEPDEILDMIAQGATDPPVSALWTHAAECAYCRRQYFEMRQDLREAASLRTQRSTVGAAIQTVLKDAGRFWQAASDKPLRDRFLKQSFTDIVVRALESRRIEFPRIALQPMNFAYGTLRDGSGEPQDDFRLLAPVGTAVAGERPAFAWQPLPDAESYVVQVYDEDYEPILSSEPIAETQWTAVGPLERGKTYLWQVTALRRGEEVTAPKPPAPEALFQILGSEETAKLNTEIEEAEGSHLLRGLLFSQAGLLAEAEMELQALRDENPDSELVQALYQQLSRARP